MKEAPGPHQWNRRQLLKAVPATIAGGIMAGSTSAADAPSAQPSFKTTRNYWTSLAERLARPVLGNLSKHTLKANLPAERKNNYAPLEAFGRLMAGIAPWLAQDQPAGILNAARQSLDAATDPASPDYMNFHAGSQPLVDAAFLSHALLRAPSVLWEPLDVKVKTQIVNALKATRRIKPGMNNWLLFAAMVEAALHSLGKQDIVRDRVQNAISKHMEWYLGDGIYGDGPKFHWDHYNSYVIQPMLLDVLKTLGPLDPQWAALEPEVLLRIQRYAVIQERMISPEGTFPVIGRSSVYRCGALQGLALVALLKQLPPAITPAQARCAMTAVLRRVHEYPGTFDANGWLTIGFCGRQPAMADSYISCGSVYLTSLALLPLGLPAEDPFWSSPDEPWTSAKIWSGVDVHADHAI